jgi:hypothetical protein
MSEPRHRRAGSALVLVGLWAAATVSSGGARAADAAVPPPLYRPGAQPPAAVANWLARYTNIAFDQVVSIGDEYIVAVLSSQPVDPAHPGVLHLEIRAELTDPDSQNAKLMRSLSASLEVNCATRSSRFLEVHTFSGANLTGAEQVTQPSEGWVSDPRGSYFEDIDNAACNAGTPRPLLPGKPSAAAPASVDRPAPQLRPAQSADASPPEAAAPAPHPARPAGPVSTSRQGGSVQIAAGASQALAEAALAQLRAAQPGLMNGLSTRVERIERGGVAYYRALVFGFTPPDSAAGFCRRLTASGHACIVR